MVSSLKARLIFILVISSIPIVSLIGYDLVGEYHTALAKARNEIGELAAADANSAQAVLLNEREVLIGLSSRQSVDDGNWNQCSAEMAQFRQRAAGVLNAGIVTPDGMLACSAVAAKRGPINLSDRDWFKSALASGNFAVGNYQVGRATRMPSINLALAGRRPGGERLVAFVALDLKWLRHALLGPEKLPKGSYLLVLDHDGTVIARSPEPQAWLGRNLAKTPLGVAMRTGKDRYVEVNDNGVRVLAAIEPVVVSSKPPLLLAIAMPVTAVVAQPLANLYVNIAVFIAAAAAVLALAWYLADRSVIGPIGRIGMAAARLAEGETGARAGSSGGANEIAALGSTFDFMAATLEQRSGSLVDAMRRLQEAHDTLNAVINASPAAIICLDKNTKVVLWNPAAERLFGWPTVEVVGRPYPAIPVSERDHFTTHFNRTLAGEAVVGVRGRRMARDGRLLDVSINSAPLQNEKGERTGVLYVINDLTQQVQTERQLQQAQKMEAIGQLTGGIAHDFNNLLGVAIGNLDLAEERVRDDGATSELIEAALAACLRGAELTRQLLAFSRRQSLRPEPIAPAAALQAMTQLLSRILGEQITLRLHAGEGLWRIIADPTQLETAVLNLAVNARDAMPKGGTLSIEIANAHLDSEYAGRQVEVAPGDYVEIAVSDTGTGMPPEVIARAFDPFFTTKDAGRGTGLGLSMVYGFIKQSGGHIKIYSEPGHGSTIKLWLPRAAQAVDEDEASSSTQPQPAPRGKETILIVEDNADIRKVVISQIESLGYRTLAAGNAQDALEILEKNDGIDLLFTDVVMPGGKDGRALADEAVLLRPGLKVLFTSGFTQAGNGSHGGEPLKAPLISKPYRKQQLAETLRKVFSA